MKNVMAMIFGLLFFLTCFNLDITAQQDRKGSKDHPLLTRMPNFYISEYKDTEFDSYKFINQDKKPISIEGHKYYFQYNLNTGAAEPGE